MDGPCTFGAATNCVPLGDAGCSRSVSFLEGTIYCQSCLDHASLLMNLHNCAEKWQLEYNCGVQRAHVVWERMIDFFAETNKITWVGQEVEESACKSV